MGFIKDVFSDPTSAIINPTVWLGTGSQLFGDYMAREAAGDEAQRQRQHQDQVNAANYAMQKEFAQMGIRWRAEDARAAGIHPLAAIGANTTGATPSFQASEPSYHKSDFYSKMGQNLSRAVAATMTSQERLENKLRLEGLSIDNQIKQAELDKLKLGPPAPVVNKASEPWQENTHPSVAYMRSPTGLVPIMPPDLAEALESDEMNQRQWVIRYKGGPNVKPTEKPDNKFLPPGAVGWKWSFKNQEWQYKSRQQAQHEGRMEAEAKHKPTPYSELGWGDRWIRFRSKHRIGDWPENWKIRR